MISENCVIGCFRKTIEHMTKLNTMLTILTTHSSRMKFDDIIRPQNHDINVETVL